jgi:hypothetical protein
MNDHRARNRIVSLADLAAQAPSVYQLLNRSGALRRRRRARALQRAGWFGAGVAVGSGIATLLTPRSGPEVRRRLSDGARRARDYVAPKHDGGAPHREGA